MNDFYLEGLYAQKIADMTCVPLEYIVKLRDRQLLHEKKVRDMLIIYDYNALHKTRKFTNKQVLEKLSGMYNVEPGCIRTIINQPNKTICYCKNCGTIITTREHTENNGMCTRCIVKSISI